jgi:hypothetical protein
MPPRIRLSVVLVAALLSSCGGGGTDPAVGMVTVWGSEPRITTLGSVALSGTSFIPRGASCTYYSGPWAPPGCQCDTGEYIGGQWSNATNGESGPLSFTAVSIGVCTLGDMWWRASSVTLQPGDNTITISISDGRTQGSTTTTILRN